VTESVQIDLTTIPVETLWAELVRRKHEVSTGAIVGELSRREDACLVVTYRRFRADGPEIIIYQHGGMAAAAGLARLAGRKVDYDFLRGEEFRIRIATGMADAAAIHKECGHGG
jgi:DNA-binding PadR family transcriptional regulator